MKVATAMLVGLITFSYAGVASAWRCAPSAPKDYSNSGPSFTPHQMSQIQLMLAMWKANN